MSGEPLGRDPSPLHLVGLSALAVAQPLYDLIGRHAQFLVAHGASTSTVLALIAVLSVAVPLALILCVSLARLASPRAAWWLQTVFVGLLAGLLAAIALREHPPAGAVPGALLAAAAGSAAYHARGVRLFLAVLSPAAVLFPVLFLTTTPVGRLVWADGPGDERADPARRPPIVVVVFDELGAFDTIGPDGAIDASRFPHLAAFAGTSTWFPNATAADPFTARAIPAILTGNVPGPSRDLLPIAADHPRNLLTWLASSYEMHVAEPVTQVCPRDVCTEIRTLSPAAIARDVVVLYLHLVVPAGAAAGRLPTLGLGWAGFDRPDTATGGAREWNVEAMFAETSQQGRPRLFRDFVSSIQGPARPVFYFLHGLLPHDPYRYRASGQIYAAKGLTDGLSDNGAWPDDAWVVEAARERHVEQARFADALLGELLARLKGEAIFDDALIVVTSDHGAAFVQGDLHRWPTAANYAEVAAVPLLIKRPGQTSGAVSERPASGIDLAPTIAGVLGTPLPWTHDGTSLFADQFPARAVIAFDAYGIPALPRIDLRADAARRSAIESARARFEPLLGQRTAVLATASAGPGLRVFSTAFDDLQNVQPDAAVVPSFVRGRVEGAGDDPLVLALAVNGTIQAVTRTFRWQSASRHFAALLPANALGQGMHQLEIFAVRGSERQWRLAPISSDMTARLRLAARPKGESLVTSSGVELPLEAAPAGQVDRIEIADGMLTLHGWAAAPGGRSAARSIVVVAGSQSVAATTPAGERPDVSAALGLPPGTPTTFAIAVPVDEVAAGLRLFAVGDESAAEITIPQNLAAQLAAIQRE